MGAAAQLKHAIYATRGYVADSRHMFVNMLLLGDGYDYPNGVTARRTSGADSVSGMGRLVMHAPQAQDFPSGAWEWNWSSFTMTHSGEVHTGTLGERFSQHRYVFTWFGDDTNNLADIDVKGFYNCPGGPRVEIARQVDYDVRNRLQVTGNMVPYDCWYEIDVIAYHIPPGQTRTIWEAWLWHNETPD